MAHAERLDSRHDINLAVPVQIARRQAVAGVLTGHVVERARDRGLKPTADRAERYCEVALLLDKRNIRNRVCIEEAGHNRIAASASRIGFHWLKRSIASSQ